MKPYWFIILHDSSLVNWEIIKAGHLHKVLMVLEPLILESREELEEKIPQMKNTLEMLNSGESEKRRLIELLAKTNSASQIKRTICSRKFKSILIPSPENRENPSSRCSHRLCLSRIQSGTSFYLRLLVTETPLFINISPLAGQTYSWRTIASSMRFCRS